MGIGTSPSPEEIALEIWKATLKFTPQLFPSIESAVAAYLNTYLRILDKVKEKYPVEP